MEDRLHCRGKGERIEEEEENTSSRKLKDNWSTSLLKMIEERQRRGDEECEYTYTGSRTTTVFDYRINNMGTFERTSSFGTGERTESN